MAKDIRSLRLEKGLRQSDVAAAMGVSGNTIRKWERGFEMPSDQALDKLSQIFSVGKQKLAAAQKRHMRATTPGEGYTTAKSSLGLIVEPRESSRDDKLRVLDVFGGCGGLSYGLEWTGHFTTVGCFDLLKDRVATFTANHPTATGVVGDIRDVPASDVKRRFERVDVLVGGPPCQGFSSIRPFRTLTEGDKRNTLPEHFVLLAGFLKPKWFIFENVVGLLTHRSGTTLESLLHRFAEAGYHCSYRVLNAALYGVPQNRERLVVVGSREENGFEWPQPTHFAAHRGMAGSRSEVVRVDPLFAQHLPPAVSVGEAIGDLAPVSAGRELNAYVGKPLNPYQEIMREGCERPSLHRATNHSEKMLEIVRHAGPNISSIPKHLISSGFSSCYSRLDADKPSTTLTVNFVHPASNRCIHPTQDRALTIREGARLQGFPDRFEFCGTVAQVVKQIGNAVPPLLARSLGEAIYKADRA